MRHRPTRWAAPLLALLLLRCGPAPAPKEAEGSAVPPGLCRVGADGGIPVADRGIGGTGAPVAVADRGIGGTGAPASGSAASGRTGIVGVITGFASVCLAGQEVQYTPDLPILVDGQPARLDSLRAGQVAVVVAEGASPVAATLAIRHEVSGPVAADTAGESVLVAGQRVLSPPGTPRPEPGSWVAVSGFRRADGTVVATRLDRRSPGEVLVRGVMRAEGGRLWIGTLEVRPERGQERHPGVPVVAIGRLNGGVLDADTVEIDALLADPVLFFGPAVQVVLLEGYAEGGVFSFGRGFRAGAPFAEGRALARLERGPGGGFAPAVVRPGGGFGARPAPSGGFGPAPHPSFQPAPVPNRGMDRAGRGGDGDRARGAGRPGQGGERQNRRGEDAAQGRRFPESGQEGSAGSGGFGGTGSFGGTGGFGGGGGFRGPGR